MMEVMNCRICMRPCLARVSDCSTTSHVRPRSFRSTWNPVMPFSVPATLKSMSPQWSSAPRMSVTSTLRLSSAVVNSPTDTPATGALIGMPASIIANDPTQMEAMDEEPLEPMISDTIRME